MADIIKHKRTSTENRQPTVGQLEIGELAVNVKDAKIFLKRTVDAAPNFGETAVRNPGNITVAADRLLANKEFIQEEVITYVEDNEQAAGLSANQKELCRRDTGYIVDAVVLDLRNGGFFKSAEAGIAYYNNGVSILPGDQVTPTANAIGVIKQISTDVISNTLFSPTYQNVISQDTSVPGSVETNASSVVTALLDGISDTITDPLTERIAVVAAEHPVNPKEIYVDGYGGNDSNDGTFNSKVKTIKRACEIAANNETRPIQDPLRTPVIIKVAPGDYVEDNPIRVPSNTSIIGDGVRGVTIRPANKNPTVNLGANASWYQNRIPEIPAYSRGRFDLFLANSGCYFGKFTVRDVQLLLPLANEIDNPVVLPGLAGSGPTLLDAVTGFAVAFDNGATVIRSPYIDDNSCISRATDPSNYRPDYTAGELSAGGGFIVDSELLSENSVLNSMVVNSFTQINEGGIGCKLKGAAFAQVVSFFTNFCLVGTICVDGGHATIANSNNSFGDFGLLATGGRIIRNETGALEVFSSLITATGQDFSFVGSGNTFLDPPFIGNDSFFDAERYALASNRKVAGQVQLTVSGGNYSATALLSYQDGVDIDMSPGIDYNIVFDRTGYDIDGFNFSDVQNIIPLTNYFELNLDEFWDEFPGNDTFGSVSNTVPIQGRINIYDAENDSALPASQKGVGLSNVSTFAVSLDNECIDLSSNIIPEINITGISVGLANINITSDDVSNVFVGATITLKDITGTGNVFLNNENFSVVDVSGSNVIISTPVDSDNFGVLSGGTYKISAPGRVFYTGTDELGDFRIGNDLVIRQRTGLIEGRTFQRSQAVLMLPFVLAIEG